ncbi:hypothetical protein ACFL3G_11425 [Planctomycetota bacterium]
MNAYKFKRIVLVGLLVAMSSSIAFAYPPDNAAVLYYKACLIYRVDDGMADMLGDLQKGRIELNDEIREFVNKKQNQRIIDTVLDASEVKNCEWGMDFSQGMDMDIPSLSSLREIFRLVIAEAKILTADGDYEEALSRCMGLYRMARHINDRIFICNLVAIAINDAVNNCVMEIMSAMPQDAETIARLKNQLIEIESIPLSIKPAIIAEREAVLFFMTSEQMADVVGFVEDVTVKEKLLTADDAFLERSKKYFEGYFDKVVAAFEMPYVEGFTVLRDLDEKTAKVAKDNPDAILTNVLAPAMRKMFSHTKRFETHNNAVKAAVEIYMVKARTGKLPEELPVGLPMGMFSGESFDYLKTDDGFMLRCRQKNLSDKKDEPYEYEFKVKK